MTTPVIITSCLHVYNSLPSSPSSCFPNHSGHSSHSNSWKHTSDHIISLLKTIWWLPTTHSVCMCVWACVHMRACSVAFESWGPYGLYSPPSSSVHRIFRSKNTGMGCHFLLQWIFLTQGSNLHLLHWQVDSLTIVPLGKPTTHKVTSKFLTMDCKEYYMMWLSFPH